MQPSINKLYQLSSTKALYHSVTQSTKIPARDDYNDTKLSTTIYTWRDFFIEIIERTTNEVSNNVEKIVHNNEKKKKEHDQI